MTAAAIGWNEAQKAASGKGGDAPTEDDLQGMMEDYRKRHGNH